MAAKPLPDQATLLKLLRYDPETGKLYWRERTPEMFVKNPSRCGPVTQCANWNASNAGKPVYFRKNQKGARQIKLLGWRFSARWIVDQISGSGE